MALETVVFPQELLPYSTKELCAMGGLAWGYNYGELEYDMGDNQMVGKRKEQGNTPSSDFVHGFDEWDVNSPSPDSACAKTAATVAGRRKRRRTKVVKNKEEVESQRMNHIAIERNRRKQMNEYLAVLRSLMPASYVQRGDQASIVGGAINFVKELEQLLQSLEAQKRTRHRSETLPFADFFSFPQYSSSSCLNVNSGNCSTDGVAAAAAAESRPAVADIEVTMVESHANLKVLAKRRPKQLLSMVIGLQKLRLTALHLNVTTTSDHHMVLYSFSLKVEDDCQLSSVDDIATAVHEMIGRIGDEEYNRGCS